MRFHRLPPLSALVAFEAVARHLSFTKAAGELYLTPSAVSQRLGRLEKQLGVRLLARNRRSVRLTAAGTSYLEAIRGALSTIAGASGGVSGGGRRLRLGIVPALAGHWLIYRLRSFHRRHPDIDLDIQAATAMADVSRGEVDVALRWGKGEWPGLKRFKLFPDELLAVCSPAYLKESGRLRRPADLKKAALLRNAAQPWRPWLAAAGLDWPEPARGPLFSDSTLALQAALDGHGVALGRRVFVQHLLEQGSLVSLCGITAVIEEAFFAVCLEESLQRAEVAAFIEWIKTATADARRDLSSR